MSSETASSPFTEEIESADSTHSTHIAVCSTRNDFTVESDTIPITTYFRIIAQNATLRFFDHKFSTWPWDCKICPDCRIRFTEDFLMMPNFTEIWGDICMIRELKTFISCEETFNSGVRSCNPLKSFDKSCIMSFALSLFRLNRKHCSLWALRRHIWKPRNEQFLANFYRQQVLNEWYWYSGFCKQRANCFLLATFLGFVAVEVSL